MDGERDRFHVPVGVRNEQQVVPVVEIGGVLLHAGGEEEDLAVDPPLVGKPRGDLGDEDKPRLLVFGPLKEPEQLPQLLVLLEGADVETRVGRAASAECGCECDDRGNSCPHVRRG